MVIDARAVDRMTEAIGATPVVRLAVAADQADVWVKFEGGNPTGSYKDRMALAMLLSVAAAANLTAILLFAAAAGDPKAAAIGTGFAVGLALLRWRTGLAGKLLLAASLATRRG